MEGVSNGGMLYHEVQESKLCAVHCVNTVLQGPFFSEFDLAALASDLDRRERQMMMEGVGGGGGGGGHVAAGGDFLSQDSHNVSLDGDFSIQVLQKALEVWDLQVIPLNSPAAEPAQFDPERENAFICHLQDHWFCIRKVNGEWYNFDSLYAAPQHLSRFYLSAYLDSLKGFGWSIFIVRGNFPKECPISSAEAPSSYGQWLSPEDAERISKSCNETWDPARRIDQTDQMVSEIEDADLKAAIAASLMDATPSKASVDATPSKAAKASVDATPSKASGDATPSKVSVDATPSKAIGDATPSKASGDATPKEVTLLHIHVDSHYADLISRAAKKSTLILVSPRPSMKDELDSRSVVEDEC
ncbi:hypothetical protein CRG98_036152 [Punica granatum]|uniref:ubiquitinyl hydrolase 1 n=1 Tax=Punica granatum TaxID=22663 RepID=A0A2I0IHB9_PUNGR|nr:hypothetical protein CRG98_036152 [Punica granatum]